MRLNWDSPKGKSALESSFTFARLSRFARTSTIALLSFFLAGSSIQSKLGAFCLDVRTLTFRQPTGFPLNRQKLVTFSRASQKATAFKEQGRPIFHGHRGLVLLDPRGRADAARRRAARREPRQRVLAGKRPAQGQGHLGALARRFGAVGFCAFGTGHLPFAEDVFQILCGGLMVFSFWWF